MCFYCSPERPNFVVIFALAVVQGSLTPFLTDKMKSYHRGKMSTCHQELYMDDMTCPPCEISDQCDGTQNRFSTLFEFLYAL